VRQRLALPEVPSEMVEAAMQTVRRRVDGELIRLAVNGDPPVGDAVAVAAADGPHRAAPRDVVGRAVEAGDDVDEMPLGIRNEAGAEPRSILDYLGGYRAGAE